MFFQHRLQQLVEQRAFGEFTHGNADEHEEDRLLLLEAAKGFDDFLDLHAIGGMIDDSDGEGVFIHLQLILHHHGKKRVVDGGDAITVLEAVDGDHPLRRHALVDEITGLGGPIDQPVVRHVDINGRDVGDGINLNADQRHALLFAVVNHVGIEHIGRFARPLQRRRYRHEHRLVLALQRRLHGARHVPEKIVERYQFPEWDVRARQRYVLIELDEGLGETVALAHGPEAILLLQQQKKHTNDKTKEQNEQNQEEHIMRN